MHPLRGIASSAFHFHPSIVHQSTVGTRERGREKAIAPRILKNRSACQLPFELSGTTNGRFNSLGVGVKGRGKTARFTISNERATDNSRHVRARVSTRLGRFIFLESCEFSFAENLKGMKDLIGIHWQCVENLRN